MVTQTYKLNLMPGAEQRWRNMEPPHVNVSQYDRGIRNLVFILYDGEEKFVIPSGTTAYIFGMKPDNNVFEYQMEVDTENSAVSIMTELQMTAAAGHIQCEVVLYAAGTTNQIGTANFVLCVEPTVVPDDAVFSETDLPVIRMILFDGQPGDVLQKVDGGAAWSSEGWAGFMRKDIYDTNDNGIVDNAEKVDNHTVSRDVLADEYTNTQIDESFLAVSNALALKANTADVNSALALKANTADLGGLAYKNNASGSYTPAGSVSAPAFSGEQTTIQSTFTPAGSVSKPDITVTPFTTKVNSITAVGTLPSCTLPKLENVVIGKKLSFVWTNGSFSPGSLPTKGADQDVLTGATAALNNAPSFTGSQGTATATYTPAGSNSAPAFTGSESTVTVS